MNYREALAWLYATQRFGIKLGLENIERLLAALPGSGLETAAPSKVIHVAGTNGKGSVCAMIEAIARAAGYRSMQFNAVVETNTRAVALWRSLGFEIIGTVPGAFRHPEDEYVGLHVMFRPV